MTKSKLSFSQSSRDTVVFDTDAYPVAVASLKFTHFASCRDFPKTPLQQAEYPRSFPVALGSQEGVQQGSLPAHPPPDRWGDNSLLAGWVAKGGGEAHLHCHFHKHFRLPHSRRSAREIPCAWLPPPSLVALLSIQTFTVRVHLSHTRI